MSDNSNRDEWNKSSLVYEIVELGKNSYRVKAGKTNNRLWYPTNWTIYYKFQRGYIKVDKNLCKGRLEL